MAFIGQPGVVRTTASNIQRVIGLSLAAGDSGDIRLAGYAGDVNLNADFQPRPYRGITLADAIEVSVYSQGGTDDRPFIWNVQKFLSDGNDPRSLVIRITNKDSVNPTPPLEIYIRFHT